MADGTVSFVEITGVREVEELHDARDRSFTGFDEQVYMIAHEDIGV